MLKLVLLTNGDYLTNIIYKLSAVYDVIVITHKKKPQGRGLKIPPNSISIFCKQNNIKCYEVKNINEEYDILTDFKCDILLLCDFGEILLDFILGIPNLISLNIHPSLLPKYRGASPIQSVILNQDIYTGYSIIEMTSKIDAGQIYYQEMIPIFEWDDYFTLRKRIFEQIEKSILDIIEKILKKELVGFKQNEDEVTKCKKFRRESGLIRWQEKAQDICVKLRAFKKWPGIYFYNSKNEKIEVVNSYVIDYKSDLPAGTILNTNTFGVHIQTGEKILNIIKVKPEGKKIMSAFDFINGERLKKGDII